MSQSLPERFSQAISKVDESQLRRTWEEFEYHVDICRVTNGTHTDRLSMSFLALFELFHIFTCNRFENTYISYLRNLPTDYIRGD
jgi:hypothetical protein